MIEIKEDDLVLGIVEGIESNTVFVRLENGKQATLIISEIAPGRIKNLREYVVPNKKIVCKVLRVQGERVDLSLRRVSSKDKKDFLERINQEMSLKAALKQVFKEKYPEIESKVLLKFQSLKDFIDKTKEDKKLIDQYIPKEFQEFFEKIINKKQKDVEAKKIIKIKCLLPDGVKKIKEIFTIQDPKVKITYLAAGVFQIKIAEEDYKKANHKMDLFTKEIESKSKKYSCELEILGE